EGTTTTRIQALSCTLRIPACAQKPGCRGGVTGLYACLSKYCSYKYYPCGQWGLAHEAFLFAGQLQHAQFRRLSDADVHQPGAAADGGAVPGCGADIFTMDHPGGPA